MKTAGANDLWLSHHSAQAQVGLLNACGRAIEEGRSRNGRPRHVPSGYCRDPTAV